MKQTYRGFNRHIVAAYLSGKTIEYRCLGATKWTEMNDSPWDDIDSALRALDHPTNEYRIKTDFEYRYLHCDALQDVVNKYLDESVSWNHIDLNGVTLWEEPLTTPHIRLTFQDNAITNVELIKE